MVIRMVDKNKTLTLGALLETRVELILGDLCNAETDVIVTPASQKNTNNATGGVNLAIHKATGAKLTEFLPRGSIHYGYLHRTPGFRLKCREIFHTHVPPFPELWYDMYGCYSNCIYECYSSGYKSIAFPSLGTGHLGFPVKIAAEIAFQSILEYIKAFPEYDVRFKFYFKNIDTLNGYYKSLSEIIKNNKEIIVNPSNGKLQNLYIPELDLPEEYKQ